MPSQVPFDLIVVDGRFRTACFLHALRTIPDERREVTFLAFHNFNPPHRQYAKYGLVEPFAEFVENSTKWGVFRRREKLDRQKLDEVLGSLPNSKPELDVPGRPRPHAHMIGECRSHPVCAAAQVLSSVAYDYH